MNKRVVYRIKIEVYQDGDMQWLYDGTERQQPEHIKHILQRMRQVYKFLQREVRAGSNPFLQVQEAPRERIHSTGGVL